MPISPSSSARGVRAATESITIISKRRIEPAFGDFKGLLARIRLRNQKLLDVHPKLFRITRVHRVFGIYEGAVPPVFWASAIVCIVTVVFPDSSGP